MSRPVNESKVLTLWRSPKHNLGKTSHGTVVYGDWCALECRRINSLPGAKVRVVKNQDGHVAIARN